MIKNILEFQVRNRIKSAISAAMPHLPGTRHPYLQKPGYLRHNFQLMCGIGINYIPSVAPDHFTKKTKMGYADKRRETVQELKDAGHSPYPHVFDASTSIPVFIKKYGTEKEVAQVVESVTGRVMAIRSGFYDLYAYGTRLQVFVSPEVKGAFAVHYSVKRGDIVGVTGNPGFTKTGELTLFASTVVILSPCLHVLPKLRHVDVAKAATWAAGNIRTLKNCVLKQDTRYRQRYLDMILNMEVTQIFKTRSKVISYIRCFLNNLEFLEVETPILNLIPTGGAARPYKTFDKALKSYLYMRIAPELRLKELLVGGLDRVFEIGKQFRNEGIDSTHNPEFTSCEFYMTYADSEALMALTEELLSGMVKELTGGLKVMYHANGPDKDPIEIDFTPPFRRIDMIEELERVAKVNIPRPFSSYEAREYLENLCKQCHINCDPGLRTARLLDKLVGHYLEEMCINPTFIMNHPKIMSPMAKSHRSKPGLTERFELFIAKKEICNAYTELNDPKEQRDRFEEQVELRKAGDDEAMHNDESYCTALEYALPPCAGWGIGIDRLTMLLTDSQNIKEVILFTP